MPKFRFETTASGQTTAFEEELASADMDQSEIYRKGTRSNRGGPWHRAIGINYQGL